MGLRYQNIIFDLYGTLVDIHTQEDRPEAWAALARFYGYQGARYVPEELEARFRQLVRAQLEEAARRDGPGGDCCPEADLGAVFLALFREKGAAAPQETALCAGQLFRAMTTDYLRLYPGVTGLLEGLRRAGARIFLLSNAQRVFTAGELRAMGLEGRFDGVYLSSDAGCKKPDRRFFDRLLMEQKLRPEECVMVGNEGPSDIAGARRAGLATVYLHSNLSPAGDRPEADVILPEPDMARLARLLLGTEETGT